MASKSSAKRYRDPQVRKQISIYLSNADWRALRDEAVHRRVPLTALCRDWLRPGLERLRHDAIRSTDPRRP
ncbi:MAG: hypothetical protein WBC44_20160 [Planctomycetaceae bacterium]